MESISTASETPKTALADAEPSSGQKALPDVQLVHPPQPPEIEENASNSDSSSESEDETNKSEKSDVEPEGVIISMKLSHITNKFIFSTPRSQANQG